MVLFVKERNLELSSDELVVQETGLRRYGTIYGSMAGAGKTKEYGILVSRCGCNVPKKGKMFIARWRLHLTLAFL